jgi:hypothetical protein
MRHGQLNEIRLAPDMARSSLRFMILGFDVHASTLSKRQPVRLVRTRLNANPGAPLKRVVPFLFFVAPCPCG